MVARWSTCGLVSIRACTKNFEHLGARRPAAANHWVRECAWHRRLDCERRRIGRQGNRNQGKIAEYAGRREPVCDFDPRRETTIARDAEDNLLSEHQARTG